MRAARPRRPDRRRHPGRRGRGRRRRGLPRWAGPRPSPPWPTAPRPSRRSTSSSGPGNRYVAEAKRQVSGRGRAWPRPSPGPPRWWWSPARTPRPSWPPSTWWSRPSTVPTGWPGWSPGPRRWPTRSTPPWTGSWPASPRRADLEATLGAGGLRRAWSTGPKQAMAVANVVAPEHLEILTDDAESLLAAGRSAGAVFLGPTSPASVGDYLAGPNHVLPDQPDGPVRQRPAGRRLPPAHPRRQPSATRPLRGPRPPRGDPGRDRGPAGPRRVGAAPMAAVARDRRAGLPAGPPRPRSRWRATTRPRWTSTSGSTPTSRRCRRPRRGCDDARRGARRHRLQPLPRP